MRSLLGLALSLAVCARAAPSDYSDPSAQLTFSPPLIPAARESWASDRSFTTQEVTVDDITYERVSHPAYPSFSLRLREPKLCDPTVRSFSGYLDIADDASLFFWAFESRSKPATDPLTVWLNGGPGCSSMTGLLFELGPCAVANGGQNTTYNPHSWNEASNIIFLDSPVQVGFSYGGKTVSNSQDAADNFYAFMQLFYARFPLLRSNSFHIAGESYAGTYIPNMAAAINDANELLPPKDPRVIPLESVLIGNGLTNALVQFPLLPDNACAPSPFAIFDEATCTSMRSKVSLCERLTSACYSSPNRFTCVPATLACWQIAGPIQASGYNPYDLRKKCDRDGEDGPLCYKQIEWIETYLNKPEIKKELGAAPDRTFESCNMKINQAFQLNGDVAHNTAALVPKLLDSGIRVLIYVGVADFMCNHQGNEAWTLGMEWDSQAEFNNATLKDFISDRKVAGSTRSVGKGAGDLTYLNIFDAGHMVPYDQPEVALDMFSRWINNKALA